MNGSPRRPVTRKHWWIGLFIAVHVGLSLYTAKGHFTDSHFYYWETESVVERGEFALSNGFEITGSPPLRLDGMVEHDGRLYSRYPALYSLLAAPFLFLFGEGGLFYLNSLALLGTVWLAHRMSRVVLGGERAPALAMTLLIGGTYFWYYSQAIWPHMLQTCLIVASSYLAVLARREDDGWSLRLTWAGALLGLSTGVRLDSIFVFPAIGTLCLLNRAPMKRMLSLLAGIVPPLTLLSYVNLIKFGQLLPFSYGVPFGASETIVVSARYVAVMVPVVLVCAVFLVRKGAAGQLVSEVLRRRVFYGLGALTLASFIYLGAPFLRGLGVLLVDMRFLESTVREPGMIRTASGAVVYAGHFKKALLQSAPFLPLVLLPLVKDRQVVASGEKVLFHWLYLVPITFAIVFCGLRWHGGMAFDMRYLLPTLPFLAILTAGVVNRLIDHQPLRRIVSTGGFRLGLGLLGVLFFFAVVQASLPFSIRTPLFLTVPLLLSVGTLLWIGYLWLDEATLTGGAAAGLLCVPLFWGGPVAMADYAQQNAWRGVSERVASRFAPHVPERSLVLGLQKDLLSKTRDVHFASLRDDVREHLPDLVRHYQGRGHRVFLLWGRSEDRLRDSGLSPRAFRLESVELYSEEEGIGRGGLFEVTSRAAGSDR